MFSSEQRIFTFPKEERLSSKKAIKELFDNGSSFFLYPFKVFYHQSPHTSTHQVLVSVAKKQFKLAVDRNLIKRRVKEAYRLNKHIISTNPPKNFSIAFIYVGKNILPYPDIQDKLIKVLQRLSNEFQN